MSKKIIALLLALVMILSLVACGNNNEPASDPNAGNDAPAADAGNEDAAGSEEPGLYDEHVTLTYCFPDGMGVAGHANWDAIAAAVNEITEEKINATINIELIPLGEYTDKMNMKFMSGEEFDVCFTGAWNPYATAVAQGAYAELTADVLNTYAPELMEVLNPAAWAAVTVDGKIYGAPLQQIYVRQNAMRFNVEMAKSYGFDYTSVTKLEDMEPYFEMLKADGVDKIFHTANNEIIDNHISQLGFDVFVSNTTPGAVKYRDDSITVVNQFASEEFIALARLMKKWNDAGYIHPEAILGTNSYNDFAVDTNPAYKPGGDATETVNRGYEIASVPFGDAVLTTSAITATNLAVGATSKNVERAVAFINLLNTDAELLNLLCHGIEGVDYEFVDAENKVIKGIEGGYPGNYSFLVGNVFNEYYTDPSQVGSWEETAEINNNADGSCILGFSFNAEPVSSEIAACQAIVAEHLPAICCGEVDDADAAVQAMNDALEAAGLSAVLAEMQAQVDAWKA